MEEESGKDRLYNCFWKFINLFFEYMKWKLLTFSSWHNEIWIFWSLWIKHHEIFLQPQNAGESIVEEGDNFLQFVFCEHHIRSWQFQLHTDFPRTCEDRKGTYLETIYFLCSIKKKYTNTNWYLWILMSHQRNTWFLN